MMVPRLSASSIKALQCSYSWKTETLKSTAQHVAEEGKEQWDGACLFYLQCVKVPHNEKAVFGSGNWDIHLQRTLQKSTTRESHYFSNNTQKRCPKNTTLLWPEWIKQCSMRKTLNIKFCNWSLVIKPFNTSAKLFYCLFICQQAMQKTTG